MRAGEMPRSLLQFVQVLAIAFAVLGTGCGGNVQTDPTPAARPAMSAEEQAQKRLGPVVEIKTSEPKAKFTADEFAVQIFEKRTEFMGQYVSQVVEVNGRLEAVTPKPNSMLSVTLLGREIGGKKNQYLIAEPRPSPKLYPGQQVQLRGIVRYGILVSQWTLMNVQGDPPKAISALDFLKEYESAEEATKARREGQFFILTGEIEQIDLPSPDAKVCTLRLKTPGTRGVVSAVFLNTGKEDRDRNATFKIGDAVKLVGECELGTPKLVRCSIENE
jgi:hypothetical protein